jgi:energy-coupling factor transporter ATP-binding protein EcfA2
MYIRSIELQDLKAFSRAKLEFLYPGRSLEKEPFDDLARQGLVDPRYRNVNVVLGNNGSGKSTVLDAIALALMSPIPQNGFRPNALIRRSNRGRLNQATVSLELVLHPLDAPETIPRGTQLRKLECRVGREGDYEFLDGPAVGDSQYRQLFLDRSPAYSVFGYGVFRRVEAHSQGELQSRSKIRHPRYDRVVTLFEDGVPLVPLSSWFPEFKPKSRRDEIVRLINRMTPKSLRFKDTIDSSGELMFTYNNLDLPFSALSDGYKGHLGWIGDLLYRLQEVTPPETRIVDMPGVVLVDEIDAHLHPAWQQDIIGALARALPKIQFIFTTHSPLATGTLERANISIVSRHGGFAPTVKPPEEELYGLSADQILLTESFGLESTRDADFSNELTSLQREAVAGKPGAATEFMRKAAIGKAADNYPRAESRPAPDWLVEMASKK